MNQITLFPHQQQALEQTKDLNRVAYYLDMGLGKTFVGAEKAMSLNKDILVVCQKSKIADWKEHFFKYYIDKMKCDESGAWCYDLTSNPGMDMFLHSRYRIRIGVINYELAWRRQTELLNLHDFTLMLDESSLIQNQGAKQSKFILKLNPDNVILLSGTPTSGKYENLWTQIHLLGWKISKDLYNRQYVNWKKVDFGGFPQWIVDKDDPYKNVDRLKSKLRQNGAVFMKTEECFELPEQVMIPVMVKSSKEYRKFQKDCVLEMNFPPCNDILVLVGDTTLTKRLYSRQLCGQYNKDKLQAFSDLASSTQDRLIVFYNFTAELDALKKIAQELDKPISEVNGHCKDLSNYENEDNSITFIQYQAGAMGLNLQKANKIVYFTLTDKSELFEQSKKRIHRIGQTSTCFYYLMMCKNSVEEDILQTLEMRKDYTDELFREYDLR